VCFLSSHPNEPDIFIRAGGQRATPKYVVVWKQEDGVWRRHVDIWNMDTP